MSVSNPVGSGGGLVAFDRDLQGMAEQMNTVGGWAEIMAQDSLNNTVDEEEIREDGGDHNFQQENRSSEPPSYPKSTEEPPYQVQVTNVPSDSNPDDLFLFFGGDEKIADMTLRLEAGRAVIEFKALEFLQDVHQKSRELKLDFQGSKLRVFKIQSEQQRAERREQRRDDRSSVSSRQGGHYPPRDNNFSRQGSRYNSQTSLASDARDHPSVHRNEHGRPDFTRQQPQQDYYQAMPPPGRGYNNDYNRDRGGFRGGFRGGRGGRGSYDNRGHRGGGGYFQGDMQRSESYSYDNERPAPINRSRTDSVNMNRRQSDMNSRTSSQFSLNQDEPRLPAVKKPSAKDIFGEAKPVDTMSKLQELEAKIAQKKAEKEKEEKERVEKERREQQAMAASHPPPHQPHQHHPQQQHHYPPQGYNRHQPPPQPYQPYHPQMQFFAPPPVFATPVVPQYSHTHHHPSAYQEQVSPRYEGVGTFKIMQRSDADRESVSNMSPPLDPEHGTSFESREPIRPPVKEQHPANQSQSSDAIKSDVSSHGRGGGKPYHSRGDRTFFNSTHKSSSYSDQSGGRGSFRGGRGGGRGGSSFRGGHSGAPRGSDAHPPPVVETPNGENNNNKENAAAVSPGAQDTSLNKEKDHHGSHASLKSRGQNRPRGGARGRSFKEKGPRNRDDRAAVPRNGEQTKLEGQKEQRPVVKKEEEKPQVKAPVVKVEVKETPVKAAPELDVSTPASDTGGKKKNKKKNPAKSSTSMMSGNKFAALLTADE